MEWKENFGMEWAMEDAQNGMEWKIVFHTNYMYSNIPVQQITK